MFLRDTIKIKGYREIRVDFGSDMWSLVQMQLSCADTFIIAGLILLGEYESVTFPNIHYNLERFGLMCELNVSLEFTNTTQSVSLVRSPVGFRDQQASELLGWTLTPH